MACRCPENMRESPGSNREFHHSGDVRSESSLGEDRPPRAPNVLEGADVDATECVPRRQLDTEWPRPPFRGDARWRLEYARNLEPEYCERGLVTPLGQRRSPPPFCRTSYLLPTALRSLPRELPVALLVGQVETPDASFRPHELAAPARALAFSRGAAGG